MNPYFFLFASVLAIASLKTRFSSASVDMDAAAAFCAARGPACGDTLSQKSRLPAAFSTGFAALVFSQAGVVAPPDSPEFRIL